MSVTLLKCLAVAVVLQQLAAVFGKYKILYIYDVCISVRSPRARARHLELVRFTTRPFHSTESQTFTKHNTAATRVGIKKNRRIKKKNIFPSHPRLSLVGDENIVHPL